MIKTYRSKEQLQAICFTDTESSTINAIIDFVGLPVSVEYGPTGNHLRIIRGAYAVIIAKVGEFIYKRADGTLGVSNEETILQEFELLSN
ncbi:hypothetical protein D3C74_210000 [compost metagenome]